MKKIALVTGSRRGIGLGIAEALGKEGYFVVLSAATPADEEVTARLTAEGIGCTYISCDISKTEDRRRLLDTVIERYGRLDVLVNNAGVAPKVRLGIL